MKELITVQKVKKDLKQILAKKISRAWKGFGSSLFLELGELHNELAWEKGGKPATSSTGEWTLSSDGAWKIIRDGKIALDAEKASTSEINTCIKDFEGLSITAVAISDRLTLTLSNSDQLEFNKAEYGFFTLVSNVKTVISYENDAPFIKHIAI